MMLKCIPELLDQQSDMINKFFDTLVYKPASMKHSLNVRWPHFFENQPFVFASPTSLINEEMIENEIKS